MKILIVDDSTAMRMIVKKTLRLAGFEGHDISECEDGAKALAAIKTSKPDLVLSDWNMPNMTGLQLLEALSALGPPPAGALSVALRERSSWITRDSSLAFLAEVGSDTVGAFSAGFSF